MMAAAARSGNYTLTTEWFLITDEDGTFYDATEDQPEGSERDIVVEFDFSAEEPAVMHDRDGGGCPGGSASCDITVVKADIDGSWVTLPDEFVREVMDVTLTEKAWERVKEMGDDPRF